MQIRLPRDENRNCRTNEKLEIIVVDAQALDSRQLLDLE
jgi:hypothetical protein